MMKKLTLLLFAFTFLFACKNNPTETAQSSLTPRGEADNHLDRFEQSIQAFERADEKQMPPKGAILFTGSSSIRMWETLAEDFDPLPVLNRGFGGSTLPEVSHYAERIVYKYKPELVVLYCGENDIAQGDTPMQVFQNFKKFIGETEKNLTGVPIVFISAKPSPDRWKLWKKYEQFNEFVRQFSTARPNLHYVDIGETLLTENGEPDVGLFIEDGLHMNEKGYDRWVEKVRPLVEELYGGRTGEVK